MKGKNFKDCFVCGGTGKLNSIEVCYVCNGSGVVPSFIKTMKDIELWKQVGNSCEECGNCLIERNNVTSCVSCGRVHHWKDGTWKRKFCPYCGYCLHYSEENHCSFCPNCLVRTGKFKDVREGNMKAKLTFELPEDKDDLTLALKGSSLWCVLWDFDQKMREMIKYTGERPSPEEVREILREIMDWHDISFDMVD
jgi:hypothetical protein